MSSVRNTRLFFHALDMANIAHGDAPCLLTVQGHHIIGRFVLKTWLVQSQPATTYVPVTPFGHLIIVVLYNEWPVTILEPHTGSFNDVLLYCRQDSHCQIRIAMKHIFRLPTLRAGVVLY